MSRAVRRFPFHCLVATGLFVLAHAGAHAAPLRSYTFTQLGPQFGLGLDNDGNVIDQRIPIIVGDVPSFGQSFIEPVPGAYFPSKPTRVSSWGSVLDGTPDGRFLIVTGGLDSTLLDRERQTFIADPNTPHGWSTLMLQHPSWTSIFGTDVNASGEVIGHLGRFNDGQTVTNWDSGYFYAAAGETTVHEFAELIPPGLAWQAMLPVSINDKGQILGWGINPEGESSTFLLTPNAVPEPGTWAVFGLMAAAAGWRARRAAQRSVSTTK